MPPIDPQKLLQALGPLLADNGGLKGATEASRITMLMRPASKLVSKCIYLNILRATKSPDAIERFIEVGGWDVLNNWLDLSRSDNNDPLLGEILEVYHNLPVTVNLLKKNSAAKTIKHLTKTDNEKIKSLSSKLVDQWTKTIRNNKEEDDKKDKLKKKEKERSERDKENDKKEKKESEKHRSSDKDSKDRHRDKDRKDRDRDRHKDKIRDKEKESRSKDSKSKSSNSENSKSSSKSSSTSHSSSHSSHSSSHSSSSSKSKDSISSSKKITPPEEVKPPSSAQSDSKFDEFGKLRPKTVRRVKSSTRSTGLFDEDEEEEVKPTDKLLTKRVGVELAGDESAEKKPRLQLTMPTLTPANLDVPINTTPPEVQHGRIKIIPAKRAPPNEIQDSDMFMNALTKSTSYSGGIKRKKKPTSVSTPPTPSLGTPSLLQTLIPTSTATSPPPTSSNVEKGATSAPLLSPTTSQIQKLPSVPSFYRDTLEDEPVESKGEEEKQEEASPVEGAGEVSPPLLPPTPAEQTDTAESPASTEGPSGVSDSKEDSVNPESNAFDLESEPKRVSNKPKKTVRWARESYLEEYFYFELDETERENVNRPKSFLEMKREEMMLDKRAMESARRTSNDIMEPVLPWRRPKLIDDVITVVEAGKDSEQKKVQAEREASVLCALFFNRVPDTPTEPDPEIPLDDEEVKKIPLEDQSTHYSSSEGEGCQEYEHQYNFEDPSSLPYDPEYGLPVPGGAPPPHMNNNGNLGHGNPMLEGGFNLPPALSQLLNSLRQQAQDTRDPALINLQGRLTHVLQNTPPQENGMLMERIMQAMEPFKNQIAGLSNMIGSMMNNGLDQNLSNGQGGPRGMPPGGPNQMGNPPRGQHGGLLGTGPPGFNMMGPGNMRPNMQGGPHGPGGPPGPNMQGVLLRVLVPTVVSGGPMMGNGGGNMRDMRESDYYRGGNHRHGHDEMMMGGRGGGPPWRGGGRGKKRGFKAIHPSYRFY